MSAVGEALDPAAVERLLKLAFQVAIEAPMKQNPRSVMAGVRWESIHEIRAELEAAGFDWRAARREVERLEAAGRTEFLKKRALKQEPLQCRLCGKTEFSLTAQRGVCLECGIFGGPGDRP